MVDDDITEHLGSSLTTHLCIITFAALSYYIYIHSVSFLIKLAIENFLDVH